MGTRAGCGRRSASRPWIWDLAEARRQVEGAGLVVIDGGEASLEVSCTDVGVLVAYLRSAPWQVPEFSVARYKERLYTLHERGEGALRWRTHRFWLAARRPARPLASQPLAGSSPRSTPVP